MSNEHVDRLAAVYQHTGTVIGKVTDADLDRPTPCTDWNVRELLNHTIGVVFGIAAGVAGRPAPDGEAPDVTAAGAAAASFEQATEASLAAWSADGIFDGTVNFGAGDMPAAVGIGINTLDTLTHAWDLSEALGLDRSIDAELAEAALAAATMTVSDDVRPGRFAPAVDVADDAPAHDRLAAFLGRRPS